MTALPFHWKIHEFFGNDEPSQLKHPDHQRRFIEHQVRALPDWRTAEARASSVVVNHVSSNSGADKTVDEIFKVGGKAVAVGGHVTKPADAQEIIAAAIKNYGHLDFLVNNSSVYEFAPIDAITEEHFHKQFNINLLCLLLVTQDHQPQPRHHKHYPAKSCGRISE